MRFFHSKRGRASLVAATLAALMMMVAGDRLKARTGLGDPAPSPMFVTTADPDADGWRPDGPERIANEIYLDLNNEMGSAELRQFASEYNLQARFSSEHGRVHNTVILTVDEADMPRLLKALEADPRVESVDPNYLFRLTAVPMEDGEGDKFPNDPRYNEQWHMKMVKAEQAWPIATGADVVTAVIDTGVAYADWEDFHQLEDLDQTRITTGYDFVHKRVEALDDQAHGSHVAGTIAQSTNNGKGVIGVAFDTSIMPVKVLSRQGSGSLSDVADGIRFSADHGATVINMSLGGPLPSMSLEDAVAYAHKKGTIVVCAAGNSSTKRREYPAGFDYAVSVSSVHQGEKLAFYTNRGESIDFAAPGGDKRAYGEAGGVLQNTIEMGNHKKSGYYSFQGTSMAAPHAAGIAALVASTGVTHPKAIHWVMSKSARPVDAPADEGYGAGILDAEAAVTLSGVTFKFVQLALAGVFVLLAGLPMLRRKAPHLFLLSIPPAVMASSGLFFLALIFPCNTAWSNFFTLGLPSWAIPLAGAAHHGNPLLMSCIIPMLLSILVVEKPALRAIVSGLSAGFAAHLLFAAALGTVHMLYIPAFLGLGRLWLMANGLLCIFLAVVLAEEHP